MEVDRPVLIPYLQPHPLLPRIPLLQLRTLPASLRNLDYVLPMDDMLHSRCCGAHWVRVWMERLAWLREHSDVA